MFVFDEIWGLRSKKEPVVINGVPGIVKSWRYELIKKCDHRDYDEERRLLFVAMTRAQQYMMVASGPNPSKFFKHVSRDATMTRPKAENVPKPDQSNYVTEECPTPPEYKRRRLNLAVHDIMEYKEGDGGGKGKDYGKKVHHIAEQMAYGRKHDDLPEAADIAKVLDGVKDAVRIETEYECALPMEQATIRGTIDLIAFFKDRIEIHDYKTDDDKRNIDSYITQLSVYGLAAQESMNVPVRWFIDFVSLHELSVEVELLSREEIQKKVDAYLEESVKIE